MSYMRRPWLKFTLTLLAVTVGFGLFLNAWSWLAGPEIDEAELKQYTAEEIAAAVRLREQKLDGENPPVLVQDVDYTKGQAAIWYPKGESPILEELVTEGKLPPVADRVGPEPIVVKGTDGIGHYGGTWIRAEGGRVAAEESMMTWLGYQNLVRWSPQGYPIVPHLAKRWEISEDNREYTFHLRKGIKWSDGHSFTADDIMYFWECEQKNQLLSNVPIVNMMVAGQFGDIVKVDDFTVKFVFPEPYGLFLESMAGPWGILNPASSPAHYLRKYHPELGDQELIAKEMKARSITSALGLYFKIKQYDNPEHPRLGPWILRTSRANPPLTYVRNPYYFMVDTRGNQLPYIDRIFYQIKPPDMINIAASNGELTMQTSQLSYSDYTLLMSQRENGEYDVRHWYQADRSNWFVSANLNVRIDPERPETLQQSQLLNNKCFRQALSFAINREDIINAEFNGQTEPAQVAPGPESFFYDSQSYKLYTEYDPDRANTLLDEIGLTKRDGEGYRTYPDGSRMIFFLPVTHSAGILLGPAQFVAEDWCKIGIRTLIREKSGALLLEEMYSRNYTFGVWGISQVEHVPILEPRLFLPFNMASIHALGFSRWYMYGGLFDNPRSHMPTCIRPPDDHPLFKAALIYEDILATRDRNEQKTYFNEILRIAAENLWAINISTPPPKLFVVKKGLRNVPRIAATTWMFMSPGNTGYETFYFDEPSDTTETIRQIKDEISEVTPDPRTALGVAVANQQGIFYRQTDGEMQIEINASTSISAGRVIGRIIRFLIIGIVLVSIVLVSIKHPYIGRRLLIMIPMLLIISVVIFVIIQLPPGNYISTYIMRLQEDGTQTSLQMVDDLKLQFYLDEPLPVQYARWMGLYWFTSFDEKDTGLLQGNMGRSMEFRQRVNDLVGERLLLTFLISLGTILFTWAMAIPIGIYSAVRQYSILDYLLTFVGFIGMCVPGFLLALLLIYASSELFGIKVSGLFSPQFASQAEWTWPKVKDLLQHIWVPVVVLGVGGTAGMIRVMRGNLLDELKKPYVITAMAKGVRPMKLLFKYPVRLALNPFISGIGGLFPMLVSGGAIVAIVLSLPTVGPLMLSALLSEDMYLAGSMLMVLSLLGIFGTLVSDLLLLWLDPRIRYEGSSR